MPTLDTARPVRVGRRGEKIDFYFIIFKIDDSSYQPWEQIFSFIYLKEEKIGRDQERPDMQKLSNSLAVLSEIVTAKLHQT